MTYPGGADLHSRVERYEAAVQELRAAQQGVRDILLDHVLFERWRQIGADLGFAATPPQLQPESAYPPPPEPGYPTPEPGYGSRDGLPLHQSIPTLSDHWAS